MQLEFRDKACVFHERVHLEKIVLQSSLNTTWFVGFGRDGRALQGDEWRKKQPKSRGCYNFHRVGQQRTYASLNDVSHTADAADPLHHISAPTISPRNTSKPYVILTASLQTPIPRQKCRNSCIGQPTRNEEPKWPIHTVNQAIKRSLTASKCTVLLQ